MLNDFGYVQQTFFVCVPDFPFALWQKQIRRASNIRQVKPVEETIEKKQSVRRFLWSANSCIIIQAVIFLTGPQYRSNSAKVDYQKCLRVFSPLFKASHHNAPFQRRDGT